MVPITFRALSISDSINIVGVIVTVISSFLGLAIAYATYKLQQYLQRRYRRLHPIYELEAFIADQGLRT